MSPVEFAAHDNCPGVISKLRANGLRGEQFVLRRDQRGPAGGLNHVESRGKGDNDGGIEVRPQR